MPLLTNVSQGTVPSELGLLHLLTRLPSLPALQGGIRLAVQSRLRGLVDPWYTSALEIRPSQRHLHDTLGRKEHLRHAVAREARDDVLVLPAGHFADVRRAVGGVAHDCENCQLVLTSPTSAAADK
jgi:hypothetical protein